MSGTIVLGTPIPEDGSNTQIAIEVQRRKWRDNKRKQRARKRLRSGPGRKPQ